MANALDDLRYISRYGYRDPWAEATKNITDSLLAYAKSRHQRDMLIADYQDKQENRDYLRGQDKIKNNISILSLLPEEYRAATLDRMYEGGEIDETTYTSNKEVYDTISSKKDEWNGLFDITKDKNKSTQERYDASNRMLEISDDTTNKNIASGLVSHYGNKLHKEKTKVSMTDLGNINKVYLGDSMDEYLAAVEAANFTGASQILNSKILQTGKSVTAMNAIYNNLLEQQDKVELEYGKKSNNYKQITDIVQNTKKTFKSYLPPAYQNMPFEEGLAAALIQAQPSSQERNDIGKKGTGPGVKTPPPPPKYVPINEISDENISLPKTAFVSLINPKTNKVYPQKFTGDIAQRMIESGQGTLAKDSAILKFDWGALDDNIFHRGMSYESPEKPGYFSMAKRENRHARITLNSGDEVTEIKTGKRYNVIIDSPSRGGLLDPSRQRGHTVDQVKYIVNGKSYNWKEFMAKFGKSIYDEVAGDVPVVQTVYQSGGLDMQNLQVYKNGNSIEIPK